jgi:2-oxoglutarate ferredoxin oxidoreductase subunit gamma
MSEPRQQADEPIRVRFGGLGGQGLVTLGAVLAEAGARSGLHVAASQAYGSRARGGATRSDVILSSEPIDFPHVHHADLLLVLAQEAYELYLPQVAPGGVVLADGFFVKLEERAGVHQHNLPATSAAMEQIGNKVAANFVMLGALLGFGRLVGEEAVGAAMRNLVSKRFLDVNLKAFQLGLGLGAGLREGSGLRERSGLREGVAPWRRS